MIFILPSDKKVIAFGEEVATDDSGKEVEAKKVLGARCSAAATCASR